MNHMFKVSMTYADVFIVSIDDLQNKIVYEVRDKEDGKLIESRREAKFIVDPQNMVHFDMRHIPLGQFQLAYQILNYERFKNNEGSSN